MLPFLCEAGAAPSRPSRPRSHSVATLAALSLAALRASSSAACWVQATSSLSLASQPSRALRHGRIPSWPSAGRNLCVLRRGASPSSAAHVRVVTYNVLAPSLCSAKRFPKCRPEDLEESVRWERVVARLDESVADGTPTVICLQEVNESWAAKLQVLFQQRGWHFAYALTPLTYNDPIGVALAWPGEALELEEMGIVRPGGEVKLPMSPRQSWLDGMIAAGVRNLQKLGLTLEGWGQPPPELEPWSVASRKQNRLLAARLKDRASGHSFVVATYHMPCLFGEAPKRQAKTIHAALLRVAVARFAAGKALVLAGDFNTKPLDAELRLLQDGMLDETDEAYPPAFGDLALASWLPPSASHGAVRLLSAYASQHPEGREPEFTNYAWVEDNKEAFRETLDYIFVAGSVEVLKVGDLPSTPLGDPVYPTVAEPSDHVLLAADLRIWGSVGSDGGG